MLRRRKKPCSFLKPQNLMFTLVSMPRYIWLLHVLRLYWIMPITLLQDAQRQVLFFKKLSVWTPSVQPGCVHDICTKPPLLWVAVGDKQECFPWAKLPVINSCLTPEISSKLQYEWCLLGHRIKVTDSVWGIFCLTPLTVKLRGRRLLLLLYHWN